jgi:glycine cleavage system aminomethyltransferase T
MASRSATRRAAAGHRCKKSIALAHIRAPHYEPDTPVEIEVTVEHHREQAEARIRKLPFFDPERKRA